METHNGAAITCAEHETPLERRVRELMSDSQRWKVGAIAAELDASYDGVRKALYRLRDRQQVSKRGQSWVSTAAFSSFRSTATP